MMTCKGRSSIRRSGSCLLDVTLFSDDAERTEVDHSRDQRSDTKIEPRVSCHDSCCDQRQADYDTDRTADCSDFHNIHLDAP